jgi:hypothetical protein
MRQTVYDAGMQRQPTGGPETGSARLLLWVSGGRNELLEDVAVSYKPMVGVGSVRPRVLFHAPLSFQAGDWFNPPSLHA